MTAKDTAESATSAPASASGGALAQSGRDYVYIVGSSTVYPFATVVAERFGRATQYKTPKVESTGSGGGLKLFCDGVGVDHPDVANSSRAIKQSEVDSCAENGVTEIVEVKIGYDGIVIANAIGSTAVDLSLADVFMALAKDVPGDVDGELIENPYKTWADVNPDLPATGIEVLGPPPTSGTRDAFVELAMEGGCKSVAWIAALKNTDKNRYKSVCHTIREDGAFVEAGENDNLIVQKLEANPDAFGIFGFSFLDQNMDKVKGALINGVAPTFEAIADGAYPVSRPLYFYAKKAHVGVIPGLREYLREFTSERAWGEEGYLSDRGLIPMPDEERAQVASAVSQLTPLSMATQ
ncbi:MAG: PstS family phosphate ABC transporter substrate-binding protein [Gammaproteobacteria bacterium]|nr:PstS family phosphate ABC transporter substrate-binding protein [Gammaproteobacteria bacterium]MBT8109268.1 PstS family phosphate ABC transporter substrate-binding protein [Gammaproteobacteria bacterium]NND46269.1 PstS family phosphate ABC transporter substrate-binding protein [Woeseiaceae bacterium]NNL43970.1 PstS family phosphate ABC transporter substrate-binding protein [Woeseiaceae bacterium]